jgi:hypothetical protein
MNTVWQRVRAGVFVASVFGVIWGAMVTLALGLTIVVAEGFDGLLALRGVLAVMLVVFTVIGVMQGLLIATGFALTGSEYSSDSFPLLRGAFLGGLIGSIGIVAIWLLESAAISRSLLQQVPWATIATTAAIGAAATTALLMVARRGALPAMGATPGRLGR